MRFLYIRRIIGDSMLPGLRPGQFVVFMRVRRVRPGQIVMIRHDGLEKIKRVAAVSAVGASTSYRTGQDSSGGTKATGRALRSARRIFLLGDNPAASTDSRHFGWLSAEAVMGRMVWPRRIVVAPPHLPDVAQLPDCSGEE